MSRTASMSSDPGIMSRHTAQRQVSATCSQIHHDSHPATVLEQVNTLRNEESFTDIFLQTDDGHQIPCHRVILAAACPYFNAMLTSGMGETTSQHVVMHDISGSILNQIIDYCYTGTFILTDETVNDIAQAANFLQFTAVEEECVCYLKTHLNATNSLETEQVGHRLFNRQLSEQAHDYSVGNFADVTFSQEFIKFSEEEIQEFISKDLSVDSEEQVYEAVMRWVYHDKEDRKSTLVVLMKKLLFELMTESFVLEIAAMEPLLQEFDDCMKIVKKARAFHKAHGNPVKGTSHSLADLASRAKSMRNFSEVMILIGEFEFRNHTEASSPKRSNLLCYDPKHDKWDELPGSPFDGNAEFSTAATHVNNDVIVLTNQHRAWLYITGQNKWSLLANRMERRNGGCLVTHNNEAFVVGGLKPVQASPMASVQHFNPVTKQWLDVMTMPTGLIHTSAVDCLNKLYVIGSTGSRFVSEMFCYHSGNWYQCPPLSQGLMHPKMIATKGCLYVLGHLDDFNMAMLKFQVINQQWTRIDAPLVVRHGAAITVCNNKMYLLGGKVYSSDYQETDEFTIECYDPDTEMWSIHGESPWLLNGHQTVTILNPSFPLLGTSVPNRIEQ